MESKKNGTRDWTRNLPIAIAAASTVLAAICAGELCRTRARLREYEARSAVQTVPAGTSATNVQSAAVGGATAARTESRDSSAGGDAARNDSPPVARMEVLGVEYDGGTELDIKLSERPDMDVVRHYVSVSPMKEGAPGFRYRRRYGNRGGIYGYWPHLVVCGEFAHRTNVTLTVRKGLPVHGTAAAAETSSRQDFVYAFTRKDAAPYVKFAHDGRYLPPGGRRAVAIETVNVTNLHAELRRVEPRNLVQMLAREEEVYSRYSNTSWSTNTKGADKEDTGELSGEPEELKIGCACAPNEKNTVALPLAMSDGGSPRGIFFVTVRSADNPRRDWVESWQDDFKTAVRNPNRYRVVCLSDLGISVRRSGADETGVWITSLTTGRPVAGTRIEIYSPANVKIAEGVADGRGWCVPKRIAKGAVFAVVATSPAGDDMAFMAVRESMMADETYAGGAREKYLEKNECTAFAWTERGIYRHGEKMFLHVLLRNGEMKAPAPFPVEVALFGPSGEAYARKTVMPDADGSFACEDFSVPAEQPSGEWKFKVKTPGKDGKVLSSAAVKVEEFAPPQIRVKVEPSADPDPRSFSFEVSAEHLYGGPARSLASEGAVVFEDVPFAPPAWKDYRFGNDDLGLAPNYRELGRQILDERGRTVFASPAPAECGRPKAAVRAIAQGVVFEDGGRPATARGSSICHYYPYYIGAKLGSWIKRPESGILEIPVACISPDGKRVDGAKRLSVKLERIDTICSYRQNDDGWASWDCERVRVMVFKDMVLEVPAGRDAELPLAAAECGDYALTVEDTETGVSFGRAFYLGDCGDDTVRASLSDPSNVTIVPDKPYYRTGETPRLLVKSPFAGTALLSVLRDKTIYSEIVDLTNATCEVVLRPVERSWAPNADVTLSVVQSADANERHLAVRAHGQATVCVRPEENEIPVEMEARVSIAEDGCATVTVELDAAGADSAVVTLVDEGIHLLADGRGTPDPVGFFAAPRTAEHPLYDIYGRILPVLGGELRKSGVKTGGGAGAELLGRVSPEPSKRFKPLALWKTGLAFENGKARAVFRLPEFAGEVRIEAVAYSAIAAGTARANRKVSPRLVMQPDCPRFVAPGDSFEVTLPVSNRSGAPGRAKWRIEASGAVALAERGDGAFSLRDGDGTVVKVKAKAGAKPGRGKIVFAAEGFGEKHEYAIELPVRPAVPWRERAGTVRLEPGESRVFAAEGDCVRQAFSVSGSRMGELTAALEWLADYPHGCLEQTSSRIFPLITAGGILNAAGSKAAANRDEYVLAGVKRVESMLRQHGFVMWPDCNYAPHDQEVSLYAAHFLVEAERAGLKISPASKSKVTGFLEGWAASTNANIAAYACHTLALAGRPDLDRMLRLYDIQTNLTLLARARLARAFALAHDRSRAGKLLANAQSPDSVKEAAFAALALMELDTGDSRIAPLVEYLVKKRDGATFSWGTTDSNAHALLAIGEYYRLHPVKSGKPQIVARPAHGGETALGERDTAKYCCNTVTVENTGSATAFVSWKALELPEAEKSADESSGLRISRRFFDSKGEIADLGNLRCGDLLVAELSIVADETRTLSDLVAEDLFAGAFEPVHGALDPAVLGSRGGVADWVMRSDARDDRMLVFSKKFTLEKGHEAVFRYPVRVVSAGDFVLPGASVEGMYHPALHSRRAASRIVVRH